MSIGGLLRGDGKNRRVPAQFGPAPHRDLGSPSRGGNSDGARRGPFCHGASETMFRSPSCTGQVRALCGGLPIFFRQNKALSDRRRFACRVGRTESRLPAPQLGGLVSRRDASQQEGMARCGRNQFFWPLRPVRAFPPAVTIRANRCFMAPVLAILARLRWMATGVSARRPGLRPTCCIARNTPTSAEPGARPRLTNSRPPCGPTRDEPNASSGHCARAGVLRARHPRTKDTACSTRS